MLPWNVRAPLLYLRSLAGESDTGDTDSFTQRWGFMGKYGSRHSLLLGFASLIFCPILYIRTLQGWSMHLDICLINKTIYVTIQIRQNFRQETPAKCVELF